jgi:Rps23 Pro-64 3,4-dihydroxylase Tpa1-like proline 4-hydroxylase
MIFNIVDNNFVQPVIDDLYFYYRDQAPWKFYGDGVGGSNWRKFKKDVNLRNSRDKFLLDQSKQIIKKFNLDKKFSYRRGYFSAQVYGMVHDFHYDDIASRYNQIITVMFYLNRTWTMEYSGETVFLTEDWKDIQHSVIPKPGRAVLFDGYIPHAAREVSRTCIELRMVATFKYEANE